MEKRCKTKNQCKKTGMISIPKQQGILPSYSFNFPDLQFVLQQKICKEKTKKFQGNKKISSKNRTDLIIGELENRNSVQ